ncbi:hypothetical protein ODV99_08115 [Enterococcus faecium]|nr:hypothetical protein [Enterococcus faecium]
MKPVDKLSWSDYFLSIKKFNLTVADFNDFIDRYKYFVPKNKEKIENLVRNELRKKVLLLIVILRVITIRGLVFMHVQKINQPILILRLWRKPVYRINIE